jgi:hypothetical protein
MLNVDQILDRATTLARRIAGDRIPENQLGMVLAHLRRHRNVGATLDLLGSLQTSPFRFRTKSTPHQFKRLKEHVQAALRGVSDWQEAAWIVGWGRRLVKAYDTRS